MTMKWLFSAVLAIFSLTAHGASIVVLTSGAFSRTVRVEDLETLVNRGEAENLAVIFSSGAFTKEGLQKALLNKLQISSVEVDKVFNSRMGRKILTEFSVGLKPSSMSTEDGAVKALRSALVQSSADDGAIQLIEVLKFYPTDRIVVDVAKLKGAFSN